MIEQSTGIEIPKSAICDEHDPGACSVSIAKTEECFTCEGEGEMEFGDICQECCGDKRINYSDLIYVFTEVYDQLWTLNKRYSTAKPESIADYWKDK